MEILSMPFLAMLGFLLAAYSVIANDSVQTLGTFMASNHKVKWQYMWLGASTVLGLTLWYSWYTLGGDISHGRLAKIPYQEIQWYHVAAPAILLLLTKNAIPVSTSLLVLSTFSTTIVLEKIILKSIVGYGVAFIFSLGLWFLVYKLLKDKVFTDNSETNRTKWITVQWLTTAFLWFSWLSHDIANIAVFLPRQLSLELLIFIITTFTILLGFMFYNRGGKIQEIVTQKHNTKYIKSAILIDLVYAFILWFFKEYNNLPMSTTFVFLGLLAGRELGINMVTHKKVKSVFPLVRNDFLKLMLGLAISISLAFFITQVLN